VRDQIPKSTQLHERHQGKRENHQHNGPRLQVREQPRADDGRTMGRRFL
jgi:hypothetical protein